MAGYNNVGSISSSWSNPPQVRRRHTVPVVQVRANIETYVSIEAPDVVYQFGQGRLIIELTDLRAIPSNNKFLDPMLWLVLADTYDLVNDLSVSNPNMMTGGENPIRSLDGNTLTYSLTILPLSKNSNHRQFLLHFESGNGGPVACGPMLNGAGITLATQPFFVKTEPTRKKAIVNHYQTCGK
jgi:hypothetical protein